MSELVTRVDGPAVERQVATDIVRRALPVVPLLLIGAGIGWGWAGTLSAGYAVILILANFWASAAILAWAARTSLNLLMGVALFGYIARLGLITVAVLAISGQSWFSPIPLGATIILTHLGLLIWETRYVSASLAYPGLKPNPRQKGI
ncbi:MAG TPA: ATP synthase subunit I [Acidimicrobiales bacterium]